jgi:transcriptional regulator with XRE-family HTH domain
LEAREQLAARHIALRERAGLTQEQEARLAGVSPTTISGIESGKITRPHLKTLLKLARALGADVGELRESGKVVAPSSQTKLFNNGLLEEGQRASWDEAVANAHQLRGHGQARIEALLSSWHGRWDRRALYEMGLLLDEALAARRALQENASVPAIDRIPLDKIPIPEWEEIGEADRFYGGLVDMVLGAGLSIHRERKPDREVHEVKEAA